MMSVKLDVYSEPISVLDFAFQAKDMAKDVVVAKLFGTTIKNKIATSTAVAKIVKIANCAACGLEKFSGFLRFMNDVHKSIQSRDAT